PAPSSGESRANLPSYHRLIAEAEQAGRAVAVVDVLAECPGRHREHVHVFPVEPLAANHRVAGTLDHVIVRAADAAARLRLLTGAQRLACSSSGSPMHSRSMLHATFMPESLEIEQIGRTGARTSRDNRSHNRRSMADASLQCR